MWRHLTIAALLLAVSATAASAQSSLEDKLREQLRSTVTQLRTLQDQQAMMQAQKAAAEQERDALRKELDALRARAGASQADARARAALQQSVAQARAEAGRASETARTKEAERARLEAALAGKSALADACMAKNGELFRTGMEILDAYQKFSVGDALMAREPLIGIYRVKLENQAQGYADRLYDGQFDPRSVQAPAAAAPAQPTPPATQGQPPNASATPPAQPSQ